MIRILSAGRSGSGWLCSVLKAAGLRVMHEGFGDSNPDVYSETSDLWRTSEVVDEVLYKTQTAIVLDRGREDIEASIDKLLGERSWDDLFFHWKELKRHLVINNAYCSFIDYSNLFDEHGMRTVQGVLYGRANFDRDCRSKWCLAAERLPDLWTFYRSFRITNQAAESGCKETWK